MNFAIVMRATANALGVTAGHLEAIASAVTVQLNRDYADAWGGAHLVRLSADGTDLVAQETAIVILDDLPAAPGAVAYHSSDGPLPAVFVALSMCDAITSGADSISVAISHECLEAAADPVCNRWVDSGSGHEVAFEVCDPVESSTYEIQGIAVSDFILPGFYGGLGPCAFHSQSAAAFATQPGGYQIERSGAGAPSQVPNGTQRLASAKRSHWSSRASRRAAGARGAEARRS